MSAPVPPRTSVPLGTRIGFGVGDFGFLVVWQGTTLFLMYFYTDVMGIDPVLAGTIYLAAMVWDAVTDPVVAAMAERTRTRWGRYRPWIALGAVPFGVSFALAFSTPGSLPVEPWIWALGTHLLLRTAYTIVSMPFNAMQARLTSDANERTVLAGFRMVGAATGGLAIVVLMPLVVQIFSEQGEAYGYFVAASLAGALAVAGLLYCAAAMREPGAGEEAAPEQSLLADIAAIPGLFRSNGPLVRVFGVIVIGSICLGMFGKNVLYHFKYDVGREDLTTIALVLPAILLVLSTPFWVWLSQRRSKRDALSIGLIISLVGYLFFFFNPSDFLLGTFAAIALIGFGGASLPVMFWAMLPDTIEYGEYRSGTRAESRTFGFATFAQKAAVGINALLLGALLGWSGFEANAEQLPSTLIAMKAIMALVPAAGSIAIWGILRGYHLDRAAHDALVRALNDRRSI
ncbi:GPH family glycoside/pentoside/hexuronide:cation symporter [Blastomonas natatoria]|jgi:GPH family glycoside/pentoside/hexuronide:cation symporter|uniref:GPH family glycoside/pentoside/hexuronide:cation symporter n=1 Tax=Blastomonas natatoria TaxID=34015 RepID=A0A2V3V4U9_9SPHN|nr:glycoside-pentoside-hexuronide (GPH):cation symporter [Blastomonas natatoria]PXW69808.1 GPH family glycoside/pentoside/hexuronide:cation symporter [Blastomonas natatoria]